MTRPRNPFHWIDGELVRVIAAASTWGFAFSSFYLLPKYLDLELGAGPAAIGTVMGVFGVATVALTPLAGRFVDRVPHDRTILAGSLLMAASAAAFLAVDDIGAAMLALRVAQAVAHILVFTAVGVVVAELAPPDRLSQALGLSGASMLVMNAIAPAVVEPLAARAGWDAVFTLAAVVALVAAALSRRIASRRRPARRPGAAAGFLAVLRRPVARHYAIVIALSGLAFGTVFTFEPPFALERGRTEVRGFYIAFAGAAILVRVFFGSVADRFGRHRVATAALGLYALASAAIGAAPLVWLDALGGVIGFAHGLFFPALNAIALTAVRDDERGRLMALFTGAFNLGFAATAVLGMAAERTGYAPVFSLAALAAGGGVAILLASRELRSAGGEGHAAALVEAA
jgi:predicted MFS family arabinose efflux permease